MIFPSLSVSRSRDLPATAKDLDGETTLGVAVVRRRLGDGAARAHQSNELVAWSMLGEQEQVPHGVHVSDGPFPSRKCLSSGGREKDQDHVSVVTDVFSRDLLRTPALPGKDVAPTLKSFAAFYFFRSAQLRRTTHVRAPQRPPIP